MKLLGKAPLLHGNRTLLKFNPLPRSHAKDFQGPFLESLVPGAVPVQSQGDRNSPKGRILGWEVDAPDSKCHLCRPWLWAGS